MYYFDQDFIFYNLKVLNEFKHDGFDYTIEAPDKKAYKGKLLFNICSPQSQPKDCKEKFDNAIVYFVAEKNEYCQSLITNDDKKSEFNLLDRSSVESMAKGFYGKGKEGKLQAKFVCNIEKKLVEVSYDSAKEELSFVTEEACGSINRIALLISSNKIFYSLILIFFGAALTFFGGHKWESLVGVIGIFIGIAGVLLIIFTYVNFPPTFISYAIIGAIIVIVSILFYYIFKLSSSFVFFIIGFAIGFLGAENLLLLTNFFKENVGSLVEYHTCQVPYWLTCRPNMLRVIQEAGDIHNSHNGWTSDELWNWLLIWVFEQPA